MRRGLILCLLAVSLAGCGQTAESVVRATPPAGATQNAPKARCQPSRSPGVVVCGCPIDRACKGEESGIWFKSANRRVRIAGPARIVNAGNQRYKYLGHWVPDRVFLSPDRRTVLGQWSGECEGQSTYLVAIADKRPRSIFVSESRARGWSRDGRARVFLAEPGFGREQGYRPGVYLVDPHTLKRTLVQPVRSQRGC